MSTFNKFLLISCHRSLWKVLSPPLPHPHPHLSSSIADCPCFLLFYHHPPPSVYVMRPVAPNGSFLLPVCLRCAVLFCSKLHRTYIFTLYISPAMLLVILFTLRANERGIPVASLSFSVSFSLCLSHARTPKHRRETESSVAHFIREELQCLDWYRRVQFSQPAAIRSFEGKGA